MNRINQHHKGLIGCNTRQRRLVALVSLCTALVACGGGGGGGGNSGDQRRAAPREAQSIVFTDNTLTQDTLYISNDDGSSAPFPITSYGQILDFARSPDGRFIAFRVNADANNPNLLSSVWA